MSMYYVAMYVCAMYHVLRSMDNGSTPTPGLADRLPVILDPLCASEVEHLHFPSARRVASHEA